MVAYDCFQLAILFFFKLPPAVAKSGVLNLASNCSGLFARSQAPSFGWGSPRCPLVRTDIQKRDFECFSRNPKKVLGSLFNQGECKKHAQKCIPTPCRLQTCSKVPLPPSNWGYMDRVPNVGELLTRDRGGGI